MYDPLSLTKLGTRHCVDGDFVGSTVLGFASSVVGEDELSIVSSLCSCVLACLISGSVVISGVLRRLVSAPVDVSSWVLAWLASELANRQDTRYFLKKHKK